MEVSPTFSSDGEGHECVSQGLELKPKKRFIYVTHVNAYIPYKLR